MVHNDNTVPAQLDLSHRERVLLAGGDRSEASLRIVDEGLGDPVDTVRATALGALRRQGRLDAHAVIAGLEDPSAVVRIRAAQLAIEVDDEGKVTALKVQRMELGEPDASGRRKPQIIPGSEFVLECDTVVVAIGTKANPLLTATCPELKLNKWGNIEADETGMTSIPGVFAGGDIVRGAATVILAMGDGKNAAKAIDGYLAQV